MKEKPLRLDYLDMAKGIGILFVILGHIEFAPEPLRVWISTFHMPLFFIISGILIAIKKEDESEMSVVWIKKARSILIPYFWFSLAYVAVDIGNLLLGKIDMTIFGYNQISSLIFYGSGTLWFLPALLLGDIFFLILKKKFRNISTIIIIIALSFASWMAEGYLSPIYDRVSANMFLVMLINFVRVFLRGIIASFFVSCGFYFHKIIMKILPDYEDESVMKNRLLALAAGAVLTVVSILTTGLNVPADLHNLVMGNPVLYFVQALIGGFGIILLSRAMIPIPFVRYFGKNSLIIMAVHLNFYIVYAGIKLASLADLPITKMFDTYTHPEYNEAFVLTVTVIATFVICIIPIEIINRWFPFVMGRKRIKESKKINNNY